MIELSELEALVADRRQAVVDARRGLKRAEELLRDAERTARDARPACEAFWWIGQSFAHCDNCGKPYWEHTHDWRRGGAVPITPDQAARMKLIWQDDESDEPNASTPGRNLFFEIGK